MKINLYIVLKDSSKTITEYCLAKKIVRSSYVNVIFGGLASIQKDDTSEILKLLAKTELTHKLNSVYCVVNTMCLKYTSYNNTPHEILH